MATEALILTGPASEPEMLVGVDEGAPQATRLLSDLGGVLVDRIDFEDAVKRVEDFVARGGQHQIVTVNLDFLSIARENPEFLETLNQADLAVADGMPVVWLSRLKGVPVPERVAGVDLFGACCEIAAERELGVFLLGAAPGVAEQAGVNLQEYYRGLRVVGTFAPAQGPLTAEDDERIVEMIRAAAPQFLFVALGAPRQDVWIREHLVLLDVTVAMGVGCVFDLYAGVVRRAPTWMQRVGLEWAFRLGQEPTRLWRRYLLDDLPTLATLLLARSKRLATPT